MKSSSESATRKWLAVGIVGVSILGIVILAGIAIAFAGSANRADTSRLVFSSVLPLLGTWVGTVLAFYFARDNLQAATDSTLALAGLTEQSTPVTTAMIRAVDIVAYDLGTNQAVDTVELVDVYTEMRQLTPPLRRLPIRSATGTILCVIHDATLTAYAESLGVAAATIDKTIGDLLSVDEFKQLVNAIGFIPESATVADARAKMGSIKNCNDVFVTASGKRDERATGWFTNTLLAGIQ
ncbi:MAG: hypothetical protein ABSH51_05850 [Solirubrobacteraceae bacterium]|jgi:hypothetical protein